ncbi:MAG: MBL fold metallo-hydrolase [Clostridia bacterium]|nr:MBL fold metallo-hydrolase [Clostridia bacterium]
MAKRRSRRNTAIKNITLFLLLVAIAVAVYFLSPYLEQYFGEEPREAIPVGDGEYIEIHVIDVGQGDSILIRTAGGDMLIDAGPSSGEDELKAYLTEMQVADLEYAVFTHPDADHIGNADMILTDYTVSNVIMPDREATSKTYERMMTALEASGANVVEPVPESSFTLGSMTVTILAPVGEKYSSTNDYSVVMRLDFGETSFMMTGDAEEHAEEDILERYSTAMLDCDVLKVGHHGSDTSTSQAFLDAVSPELALISCGEGNTYGHPYAVTLQKLEAASAEIYRTDEWGSIVLISDGVDITVQPQK